MKIRFSSAKEHQPAQEQGLKVLYAPGKRMAFKVRWYLILLVVASPLLWLAARAWLSVWLIEAPAQLQLRSSELRAREPAQVQSILVSPGQRVEAGQVVLQLDNPEWRQRLTLLADPAAAALPAPELAARERDALQRLLASAEARLVQMSALLVQQAATRAEVQAARDERDRRQRDLLQFDRQQNVLPVDIGLQQRQLERHWLEGRLDALQLGANESGVVSEVLVSEGENVGPGTLLLRLQHPEQAQLWVYLDPRDAAYAVPGQPFELLMPDGSRFNAEVVRMVEDTISLPAELQPAFGAASRRLRVMARIQGELPEHWRIDRLGLLARFPHHWAWLGL
ncbi:HlyD family secretion protein [Ectopseudomonas oleovorans]|uniref:Biotin/lipoyl-binding protein n=1 Tax=Ectopseudomonas oleovorans TaxID=301 RepID=A0AA42TT45_ECTOL|nr:HlyD family efflux transporter periplasmic adaptor subunit [Pseudomonas oleovorans]MDH1338777.1 biotin/lipoyl-binding protein [Pseudomonas oleovorans]MDH1493410.1 biotin/lipoyl-binding protein [Pseudomonas oleovorans]WGG20684.1 biotin/lipoyl-binding protein [Pseudomonas oleovorans]